MLIDERYRPPLPDIPPSVPGLFEVKVSEPHWGSIDFNIVAGNETIEFSPSHCWTDLETLRDWLEEIATGHYPCISLDAEGWWIYMMVTPAEIAGTVRFNITFAYSGEPTGRPTLSTWARPTPGNGQVDNIIERMCNIILPRRQLVEAFYVGLLDIWEKPDEETFWHMWFLEPTQAEESDWDDEEIAPMYFEIKSAVVDAYLKSVR